MYPLWFLLPHSGNNQIIQLIDIIIPYGEVFGQYSAHLVDGFTDSVRLPPLFNPGDDVGDDAVPLTCVHFGIDAAICQDPDPVLEHGNEDQDAGFISCPK